MNGVDHTDLSAFAVPAEAGRHLATQGGLKVDFACSSDLRLLAALTANEQLLSVPRSYVVLIHTTEILFQI